jgi:hypothetical protein
MAVLAITPDNVISSVPGSAKRAIAGVPILPGQLLYIDTSDSFKAKLTSSNGGTALIRTVNGVALTEAAVGQPVLYIDIDPHLIIGASGLTIGDAYFSNATAGAIGHLADQATGDYPCFVGIANSATEINFVAVPSSGVKP